MVNTVPIQDFGKDHFSLLAYVEALCVESIKKGVGEIDYRRMRVNENTHGPLARNLGVWRPEHGSRLKGYWNEKHNVCPSRRLDQHDDIDCLDDLGDAGLVEIISLINGFVRLTDKGREIAARLRAHKSRGGVFATFGVEAGETAETVGGI